MKWSLKSGADFAAFRQSRDAVGRAERQGFDGHGGLAAPGSHQAAAVAKEEVLHIMCPVVRIDYRRLRIVSHAAGAEEVYGKLRLPGRKTPMLLGAGGFQ